MGVYKVNTHTKLKDKKSLLNKAFLAIWCCFFLTAFFMPINHAKAQPSCPGCACATALHAPINALIYAQHRETRRHITREFQRHRNWYIQYYYREIIGPAIMKMTEQLSAVAMYQMYLVGTLFDAKLQLETQLINQTLEAEAQKNYSPDTEICSIGSTAKSLAANERSGELTAHALADRMLARQLLGQESIAAAGDISDKNTRAAQFKNTYCNDSDNNTSLALICNGGISDIRVNKDIDYGRLIGSPLTVDVTYGDTPAFNDEEEDLLALSYNLYGHNLMSYLSPREIAASGNATLYLDARSVAAKRSVAMTSFNALAKMKSAGLPNNPYDFMGSIVQELGVTDNDEIIALIGENPSYYAQMEILSKKLYQRPEFYINLYDKPANLKRKAAAMHAVGLMQNMDLFDSNLRSEALMAVLLELKLMKQQKDVRNRINAMRP
jgi:hypothetical protein